MKPLSDIESADLFAELRRRGIYSLITISARELRDFARDCYERDDLPEFALQAAAEYIWDRYDCQPEINEIYDLALHAAREANGEAEE